MLWRALLVTSGVATLVSVLYLVEGIRYPWGTAAQPGPAVYLLPVGLLLLIGSLGVGIEALLQKPTEVVQWPDARGTRRVLAILAAVAAYMLLLPNLGHPLSGALVVLVVLQVMRLPNWPLKIGLALLVGLGSYYVFAVLLGVPLPRGMWFDR